MRLLIDLAEMPERKISRAFLKIICRFGGQISPCLWVGKAAHWRK